MKYLRFQVLIALLVVLGFQIGTSFHYHKDKNTTTGHCAICVLGHQAKQTVVNSSFSLHQTPIIEENIAIPDQEFLSVSCQSSIRSRAPPSV